MISEPYAATAHELEYEGTNQEERPVPTRIRKGVATLCAEAEAQIEAWEAAEAIRRHREGGCTFVDLRDVRELWREGTIPGSVHVPRGMLEFWLDPESPYAKDFFQSGARFVFFCAGGMRSALATRAAQEMGLTPVCHIEGGLGAWREAGGPIEAREPGKSR